MNPPTTSGSHWDRPSDHEFGVGNKFANNVPATNMSKRKTNSFELCQILSAFEAEYVFI